MFTSLRGDEDRSGILTGALLAPLSSPLWVGESRSHRLRDGAEYSMCDEALKKGGGSILFQTTNDLVGTVATEAVATELQLDRVVLTGVGRRRIASIEARRPWYIVRSVGVADDGTPSSTRSPRRSRSEIVTCGRARREAAEELWRQAAEVARRVQQRKLESKLRKLGGAASSMLLSMPFSEQVELSKAAEASGRQRPARSSGVPPGLGAMLDSGVSLSEEVAKATDELCDPADEEACLSLGSFVALRLASGCDDAQHAWGSGCLDSVVRWEAAEALIEAKLKELQAVESLLAATEAMEGSDDIDF